MFTVNRELLGADGAPSPVLLERLLQLQSENHSERLDKLADYVARHHAIESRRRMRGLPNNRLIHDLPGYIVALTSSYLVGAPVKYTLPDESAGQEAFDALQDALRMADSGSVDAELAVDASTYGKGVELCYADEQARPRVAQIDARRSFVVYDDTVEHAPLFGVSTSDRKNELLQRIGENVTVYTASEIIHMQRDGQEAPAEVGREPHFFGGVPMIEYWNNARETGDFEGVMSLIDAYDALESDRVNDKQQFTDAIFVLKGVGALGADDTEEVVEPDDEDGEPQTATTEQKEKTDPSVRLRQTRTLFLPGDGADAQFVTKPDAESGNEVLKKAISGDIHKLSFVPDLTDEMFSGNSSGVAMRFKLFGLEQLTNTKERWFREGLRTRLRLLAHFLSVRGAQALDASEIQIAFTRSLPVNDLEIAQTVAAYDGHVSDMTLLQHIPWVDDAEAELQLLQSQRDEQLKRQQQTFEAQSFRDDTQKDQEQ
ncbi:MAG: phage portal protein [Eubacteriales bacterium]|nr:phage portal protein [Eubacteriales bacterium]